MSQVYGYAYTGAKAKQGLVFRSYTSKDVFSSVLDGSEKS